jgi:hypothetical protein
LAVGKQVFVRLPHGRERFLTDQTVSRLLELCLDPRDAAARGRDEQVLLGCEEPEEVRLGDAGPTCNGLGRGAGEAAFRELGDGRTQHLFAPLVAAHSNPGRCHDS